MYDAETQAKIANWRARISNGEILPPAEMAEAIRLLRAGRVGASIASEKSRRTKAKAEVPDADALLKEMGL
ncbi:MAG: hypothetical protein E6Q97_36070 [Desulfurellales bacterium]|nr:MAG: hypothetical protein E6Q97_36070 [Desulfurellales bacterium]